MTKVTNVCVIDSGSDVTCERNVAPSEGPRGELAQCGQKESTHDREGREESSKTILKVDIVSRAVNKNVNGEK